MATSEMASARIVVKFGRHEFYVLVLLILAFASLFPAEYLFYLNAWYGSLFFAFVLLLVGSAFWLARRLMCTGRAPVFRQFCDKLLE